MDERQDGAIPEVWPPADPIEPVRVRRIHWLLAPPAAFAAMLFPRRAGPHLAASGWLSAYVAHLFSLIVLIGLCGALAFEQSGDDLSIPSGMSLSEHLRRPFAAVALMLVAAAGVPFAWFGIAVGALLIQAGVWLGAFFFMTLFAAGERMRLLYFRTVKLMLWSTSALIAVALAVTFGIGPIFPWLEGAVPRQLQGLATFDLLFLCILFLLSVVLRLGGSYGGPKDGPRWQSGPLRCEGCGYALTGLPADARCPECGRAISDSLPDRRRPPLFACVGSAKKPGAFVQTVVKSWSARRFASTLSVQRGYVAARRFAAANFVLIGLLAASLLVILFAFDGDQILAFLVTGVPSGAARDPVATGVVYGVLGFEVSMLAGALWLLIASSSASRFGWRDARQCTVVACYATGWLYIPTFLTVLGVYVTRIGGLLGPPNRWIRLPIVGGVPQVVVIGLCAFAPAAAAFVYSLYRVKIMRRETRYANG